MKIKVSFIDVWETKNKITEEEFYLLFLDYLNQCVINEDLTAFDFSVVEEKNKKSKPKAKK